jgi:hypothetical protein
MSYQTMIQLVPLALVGLGFIAFYITRKGYSARGGRIVVRCIQGHLFTTVWIPFVSFKAIRLGPVRFQHCPVGNHWSYVVMVDETKLTEEEKLVASQYNDSQIP